jgi:hypothetical protein
MKKKLNERFDISDVSKTLIEVEEIRNIISGCVGEYEFKKTLKKVKDGTLDGFRGEVVYGLIEDCIHEGGEEVESFGIHSSGVDHRIEVVIYEYLGIYFIEGMYLDPIGYFYSREAAKSFGYYYWDKDKKTQDWREDL